MEEPFTLRCASSSSWVHPQLRICSLLVSLENSNFPAGIGKKKKVAEVRIGLLERLTLWPYASLIKKAVKCVAITSGSKFSKKYIVLSWVLSRSPFMFDI